MKSETTPDAEDLTQPEKRRRLVSKLDSVTLLGFSNLLPFRWLLNQYRCFCCDELRHHISEIRTHTIKSHTADDVKRKALYVPKGIQIKVEVTDLHCSVCYAGVKNVDLLKSHLAVEHAVSFHDDVSDALIPFKLGNDTFDCQMCDEKYKTFHLLNQHANTHFRNKICEQCGASFANNKRYLCHKSRHKISSDLTCDLCDIAFKTQYKKQLHMTKEHDRKASKHRCPYCPERFGNQYSRVAHMVRAHDVPHPDFKCQFCDKTYLRRSALTIHVRCSHMNEKSYKCDICGRDFFSGSRLRKHLNVHMDFSHTCEICHKSFSRRDNLKQHYKIHTRATD